MFSCNRCSLSSVYFYTISVVQGYQNLLPMVSFLADLSIWFLSYGTAMVCQKSRRPEML